MKELKYKEYFKIFLFILINFLNINCVKTQNYCQVSGGDAVQCLNTPDFDIISEFESIIQNSPNNVKDYTTLNIHITGLTILPANAFTDITFKFVYISNAKNLVKISTDAFNGRIQSVVQEVILLDTNLLTNNDNDYNFYKAFNSLPKLVSLQISLNPIVEHIIPESAFGLTQNSLNILDFDGSFNISNIENLAFSGLGNLTELDFSYVKFVKHISSKAFIFESVNDDTVYIKLMKLGLSEVSFDSGVFSGSKRKLKVNLASNNIKYIYESTFGPFYDSSNIPGGTIDFDGNPLDCDDTQSFEWILQQKSNLEESLLNPKCSNGTSLWDLIIEVSSTTSTSPTTTPNPDPTTVTQLTTTPTSTNTSPTTTTITPISTTPTHTATAEGITTFEPSQSTITDTTLTIITSVNETISSTAFPTETSTKSNQSSEAISTQTEELTTMSSQKTSSTYTSNTTIFPTLDPKIEEPNPVKTALISTFSTVTVFGLIAIIVFVIMNKRKILIRRQKWINILNTKGRNIDDQCLCLQESIGNGNYGVVYLAQYIPLNEHPVVVAVKTPKKGSKRSEIKSCFREGMLLLDFSHNRVMTPFGISIKSNGYPLIIYPFMKNGDLLALLRNKQRILTVKSLLEFGHQISDGMEYLSNHNFVHRDLAARNCLLDDNGVKIGDFGLSRDIYSKHYYRGKNKVPLPVKWMAPEAIEEGFYSTVTGVWSFGVLIWEIMTRGSDPYPDVKHEEIIYHIKSNQRLPKPPLCSDRLYNLLLKCWDIDKESRPKFFFITRYIKIINDELTNGQYVIEPANNDGNEGYTYHPLC